MIFTKTYYLVKVVGQDSYRPRKYIRDLSGTTLEHIMSTDIGKCWYAKEAHAKGAITQHKNYHSNEPALEIVPITVKIEV